VWKLYNDIGHGLPKEGLKPIWDWMFVQKRDPLPQRVLWEPSREYTKYFYWIRTLSMRERIDVRREGNKFIVTGSSSSISILLNEKMVKFDQPVIVTDDQGNELFHGKATYSLVVMVESIDAKRDPEMWFSSRIALP
jgi:hypothetical protein